MPLKYKHILWDWNGTLLNDSWLCVEVLNGLLKERNKPLLTLVKYRSSFDFPVIEFYKYLQFETDPKNFELISHKFINQYEERWLKECKLHTKAVDTLLKITDIGISQSILSAAHFSALEKGLSHFKIKTFFDSIIGTNNIYAEGKIENAKKWMAGSKLKPKEILLIGDTLHDYEVAKAIGANCALIPNGHCSLEKLRQSNAEVVQNAHEILNLLKS